MTFISKYEFVLYIFHPFEKFLRKKNSTRKHFGRGAGVSFTSRSDSEKAGKFGVPEVKLVLKKIQAPQSES